MKFTKEDIGKRVRLKADADRALYHFESGVICHESHKSIGDRLWIGIDIGVEDGLHDCDGACGLGCGVWAFEEDFELF